MVTVLTNLLSTREFQWPFQCVMIPNITSSATVVTAYLILYVVYVSRYLTYPSSMYMSTSPVNIIFQCLH